MEPLGRDLARCRRVCEHKRFSDLTGKLAAPREVARMRDRCNPVRSSIASMYLSPAPIRALQHEDD